MTFVTVPLPGVSAAPDENPAQWVFLPSDSDWGTHLQVPKGIQPSDLCCIEPSGHIAKVWTLRREKDTTREVIVPGWKWWLHRRWSQEGVLWVPERNLTTLQCGRDAGLSQWLLKEMGACWVPSMCHLLGKLLHRATDSQSILSVCCRGWERGMSGDKAPSASLRRDRSPSHRCGQTVVHTMSPS